MLNSVEIPDCFYLDKSVLIRPRSQTPKHHLYLSNLDDQKFLRFTIKYLYVYKKSPCSDHLKSSLSRVLVDYYPLAGRLRLSEKNNDKLEVDCNGEGAVFAEAFIDLTADEFLAGSERPNWSWRKLLYKVDVQSIVDVPPLVIQVTELKGGGMILCVAFNHCLIDGVGSSEFLRAWAHFTSKPDVELFIKPFHSRHVLEPRHPPKITSLHPEFTNAATERVNLTQVLQSQPLIATSSTFTATDILQLKKLCVPSLKCTSFEALSAHVWRCWVKALNLQKTLIVKLLFSVNIRKVLQPELPKGFYGNAFVLGSAEWIVEDLIHANLHHIVKRVQEAKRSALKDEHVRSTVDLLEKNRMIPDLNASLVISQWAKMDLENLDFGEGRPIHMGPLSSVIHCLFLPVINDVNAITVMISVPESIVDQFTSYMKMTGVSDKEETVGEEQVCQ